MKKILIGIVIGIGLLFLFILVKGLFVAQLEVPKNHVTVRISIKSKNEIDKLTLTSSSSKQIIKLEGQTETVIIFPNPGEGTFKICILFSDGKEVCSKESYVEAGYSPKLELTDNEIRTVEWN
ncbi:hypothetical protein I2I11_17095 [Pontibacter sp. 172403-2]|uniref:hypothetical protein n=1 Tax=Pontibacter rufus TaxID=2791028 RepID=UPI0018AFFEBF|nr:hypothetical protein [Pontibacter sp. 172403-2]MBF9255020.1 hypothetical protein [Pontibacter sp. 172403-2]